MGLFKKKTAAVSATERTDDEQPTPQPYRHVPVHAASDSMTNGGQSSGTYFDRQRIELESRRRMKFAVVNEPNAGDAAYLQAMARGAIPRSHSSMYSYGPSTPRGTMSRSGSGYFTPSMPHIADTDEDPISAPSEKLSADAATLPHWSNDSGYNSATSYSNLQSRTPSEHGKLDCDDAINRRAGSDVSGNVEPSTEPELSETSSDDVPIEIVMKKTQRGVLKVRRASPPPDDDPNADARSVRSVRSTRSTSKHTRFEQEHHDAVPPMPKQHREEYAKQESRRYNRGSKLRTPSPGTAEEGHKQPLSSLEGFRVNSKGQVLNEEGEWVGELVEGDLAECVRQRVNENGQVIDATGNAVGRVGVISTIGEKRSHMTPVFETRGSFGPDDGGEVYSYNGEIPATNSAAVYTNLPHQRSISLNSRIAPPPFHRHATTGMLALSSSHYGPAAGRRGVPYAVGVPIGRPGLSSRHSYAAPGRRSDYASQEHSPVGPKEGLDTPDVAPETMSRTLSIRTNASAQTLQSKPRTYFTHAGQITVDGNELASSKSSETLGTKAEKPVDDPKSTKRKSRFSGMFQKKKDVAAK